MTTTKLKIAFGVLFLLTSTNNFSQNIWIQKNSISGLGVGFYTVFTINEIAYILTGPDSQDTLKDLWAYNPIR